MLQGSLAWIEGKPLRDIEIPFGCEPDHKKLSRKSLCPRARELVVGSVPRSFTFAIVLIARALGGLVDRLRRRGHRGHGFGGNLGDRRSPWFR